MYEYRYVQYESNVEATEHLTKVGKEGWRVIQGSVEHFRFLLEREIPKEEKKST